MYEGSEGELYDLANDPHQFENLWDVPEHRAQRDSLLEELTQKLPPEPDPENRLPCVAPV
jgi:hypothetical protein